QNMGKNQNIDNIMGIIFLPKNPLFFKNQPFYNKKLCGVSILERNVNILSKNGIRDIFILSKSSVDFNNEMNFDSKKFVRIIKINNLNHVKEHFNRKKKINSISNIAVVLDGGVLIDDRIISSLLNYEKDIIFIKGNSIHSNNNTDKNQSIILGGKINLTSNKYIFEKKVGSFPDFFNSLIFNKTHYHSSDEIYTYKPDMRRDVPLYIYSFRDYQDFKSAKKFLVKNTQKGTLDLIAWYFNRPFENIFVYLFADTKITANHITIFVNILGYFVLFLFLIQYWWIGLFLLILVNILDGVDGKLARLKNQESVVGHIEHSFDQLYEQAIYVGIGLASYFIIDQFFVIIVLIIMLLSDSFNRHCSMQYKEVMKITLADSSKFDQLFRKFDGRRNIFTLHILIFGIFGQFKFVIFSICIHAIITSIIYSVQAIKHMKKVDSLNRNKITENFKEV
ncbi:MAG TPA: CDP-alcohol phosphatidyltransferase family protein, partial [bacterium]|nr:CDP-alcohol phosphatidyltransferase family protein [bacterium]